jgi:hypothetical protein
MVRVKGPQRPDDIVGHGAGEGAYVITIRAASQSAPKSPQNTWLRANPVAWFAGWIRCSI